MPYCELEDADQRTTETGAARGRAALFHGVPLASRMRPGPPLDPEAAALAGFVNLLQPLRTAAPDGLRLRAGPLATRLEEGRDGASATRCFGDLDAVTASEVLRTPSLLTAAG